MNPENVKNINKVYNKMGGTRGKSYLKNLKLRSNVSNKILVKSFKKKTWKNGEK